MITFDEHKVLTAFIRHADHNQVCKSEWKSFCGYSHCELSLASADTETRRTVGRSERRLCSRLF